MASASEAAGDWRLRRARPADAEALASLHLEVWDDAYADLMPAAVLAERRADTPARMLRWRERLGDDEPPTMVAETADPAPRLLGFATAGPPRDEPPPADRELWALYVRAPWWGTRVGWRLLRSVLGDADAYLWVLEGNERATRFYRRQGFAADGAVRDARHGRERRLVRHRTAPPE